MVEKLTALLGVVVFSGGTQEPGRYTHAADGTTEIFLRPKVAGRINKLPELPRSTWARKRVARSIFVLGHELGHINDEKLGRPYSEESANHYAAVNFRLLAAKLGVTRLDTALLWRLLPPNWRSA